MYVLMQCVAEAVVAKGVRGLAELVPGGGFLYDIANEAHRRLRDRKRTDQIREEVVSIAAASVDEVRRVAAEVVREVAKDVAPAEKAALELYLTQVPGAVRASFRRAEDPSGRSVPDQFALHDGNDLARRLPSRLPRFRPGEQLPGRPGWVLGELLGSGGFGEVWLARNPSLSALKGAVKFGTDPQARERLLRHEGGLVSRVMEEGRHPNIVPLLDAYLEGDTPWLMYEYINGGELGTLIGAWLPADRAAKAVAALRTLAAAVGHFHRLSPPLVHRDLKPANILVRGTATAPQLLVADFGIGGVAADAALAAEATRRSSGYLGSQLWGSHTPLYASPQQQRGEKPDPRDDVHALGVIGYQMLTGKLDAAPGADFARTLKRLNVPEPVIELLGDCAAHDPEHRPRDATELAERLGKTDAPILAPAAEPKVVACPSCGVSLRFRAGATALRCTRCGTVFNPSEASAPPKVAVIEAELAPPPPPPPLPTARAVPVTTRRARDDDRPRRRDDDRGPRREREPAPPGGFNPLWVGGAAVGAAVFIAVLVFLVRGRGGATAPPAPPVEPPGFVGTRVPGGPPGPPAVPGTPAARPDLIKYVRDFTYAPAGTATLFRHSPDGTALLMSDAKGSVAVVGLDGKEHLKLDTGVTNFRPALFAEGGTLVAAASFDGRLSPCVIPLAEGIAGATELVGLDEKPTAVAVSKSGTWVAAGGEGGSVRVWNPVAAKKSFVLNGPAGDKAHPGPVTAAAFAPDGKYLVTAGGGVVWAWKVSPQWTEGGEKATADGDVFEVGVQQDGKKLVAGTKSRGLRVWDFPTLTNPAAPADGKLTPGGFTRVAFGGGRYAALSAGGKYGFWDATSAGTFGGGHMTDTLAFTTTTTDIVFGRAQGHFGSGLGSESMVFAAANTDGTVLLWHMFHRMPAVKLTNLGGPVAGVSFTADGKGLATAERSGRVRIWGEVNIPAHVGAPVELAAP